MELDLKKCDFRPAGPPICTLMGGTWLTKNHKHFSDTPKPKARKLLLADCPQLPVFHTFAVDMEHPVVM